MLEPLQRSESVGVCGGFIKDGNGNLFLNRYVVAETTGKAHFLQSKEDSIRKIAETGAHRAFQTATGCNMAFSRAALHVTGGFDRFYAYFLEETDLIKRMNEAGFFCAIAETSVVFHRLGTNITRQKTPDITERIAVIRSQIHYCGKFAKETCKSEEIELVIWERILTDLEKIAWESIGSAESCGPIQSSYLEAVERQLELDSGG